MANAPFWDPVTRGYEGPLYAPDVHDQFDLDGEKLPGIWRVEVRASRRFDQQKAAGRNGAGEVFHGYNPGDFTATGTIWTPEQDARWQEVLDTYWNIPRQQHRADALSAARKRTTSEEAAAKLVDQIVKEQKRGLPSMALDVFHPDCARLSIRSAILIDVTGPREVAAGARSWSLHFREWFDPSTKGQAPVTRKTRASSSPPPAPTDINPALSPGIGTGPNGETLYPGNMSSGKPSDDVGP